ncbi:MAG: helix-turn-helix domain-containing protein [Phycisphaeraceae bacterium]|nr:helix-turn-helix domain-containing protein [Phycisphaeraceae bacterium]
MAKGEKHSAASESPAQTLGEYLANLRSARKFTLRDVEEASGSAVSNAYLSQLEHGRIKKPSPWILKSLADLYGVSYESLMAKAGYLEESEGRREKSRAVVAAGANPVLGDLTPQEEEKLLEYLAFMRSRQPKR